MGKEKPVVTERRSGEKLEEDKAARTGVGRRIHLMDCYFSGLCGLGKSGHVSVAACVKWRW